MLLFYIFDLALLHKKMERSDTTILGILGNLDILGINTNPLRFLKELSTACLCNEYVTGYKGIFPCRLFGSGRCLFLSILSA